MPLIVITNIGTRPAAAHKPFAQEICSFAQRGFLSVKKRRKLSCKTGCNHHIYLKGDDMTWGRLGVGVFQASVMTWGGPLAKPPVMPKGVTVHVGMGLTPGIAWEGYYLRWNDSVNFWKSRNMPLKIQETEKACQSQFLDHQNAIGKGLTWIFLCTCKRN